MNNTRNMDTLTRKRGIENISESREASSNSTLLMQLRSDGYWRYAKNQATMTMLITYQSEFPRKIREKIAKVAINATNPETFCRRIQRAWYRLVFHEPKPDTPWRGLDFEIDTQAEIEVAFRTFPHSLLLTRERANFSRDCCLHCLSTSLKSLPFVTPAAELAVELLHAESFQTKHAIAESLLRYSNEEYEDQLDEVSLSVMKLFIERKFIETWRVRSCCYPVLLRQKPSRVRKTLLYLINQIPEILAGNPLALPLVVSYLEIDEGVSFEHLQMLFELGMIHYPESMGCLFHHYGFSERTIFQIASEKFGKERVNKMVQEVLSRTIGGNSKAILSSIFATHKRSHVEDELDALYLLCRLNPDIFVPLVQSKT